MTLQAAMSLHDAASLCEPRSGLYNVLAWLKRHRARRSPRGLRFELEPGKPVVLVLEPWEQRIVLHSTPYAGPRRGDDPHLGSGPASEPLARLLPLAESADVYLLGTGLPSFWSVRLGEMRLLLGLSGWTANDWTGAGALDQLAPPAEASLDLLGDIVATFKENQPLTFACKSAQRITGGAALPFVAAGLESVGSDGAVGSTTCTAEYTVGRQIMPAELSLGEIGSESPETAAG